MLQVLMLKLGCAIFKVWINRMLTLQSNIQVQGPDGTWRNLLLSQGQMAILAGYTLERATCALIKAPKHKVVCRALIMLPAAH